MTRTDQRNYAILAVFLVGAAWFLYSYLSVPDARPPAAQSITTVPPSQPAKAPPSAVKAKPAHPARPHAAHGGDADDGVAGVHGQRPQHLLGGAGPKDLVLSVVKPVVIPQPIAPVRTQTQAASGPPPIDLKFFGTETVSGGERKAFLLHGEDVFFVAAGDIVQRRYRVCGSKPAPS